MIGYPYGRGHSEVITQIKGVVQNLDHFSLERASQRRLYEPNHSHQEGVEKETKQVLVLFTGAVMIHFQSGES